MCDDFTETENSRWLAGGGLAGRGLAEPALTRRNFGKLGAGAAAFAALPGCMTRTGTDGAGTLDTTSRTVSIPTPDGQADAFFAHPAKGRYPAVILWPDIAGLREAYRTMGTRLAAAGYAVLLVNQYYRSSPAPILDTMAQWRTPEGQAKLKPMIAAITTSGIARDATAFINWLDQQPQVDTRRKVATLGYCMTGPYTLRTAAAVPNRVGAACSFHGANMANDTPDSPHLLMPRLRNTALLIAIARNDDARNPQEKTLLREAADKAGVKAEIEVYPAQHGWCTLDSPVYDQPQAERAWARMLETLSGHL